jgi:hypothetical protein
MKNKTTAEPWVTADGYCVKRLFSADGWVTGYKVWPLRSPHQAERVLTYTSHEAALHIYLKRRGLVRKARQDTGVMVFGGLGDLPMVG